MLSEGADAPAFRLPGTDDASDDFREHSLGDALGSGPVLLNFYLFDFNPQCTGHLCSLHDAGWFEFDERLTVFGISTDRSFSHSAFAKQEGLQFPLLSDSDGTVAEQYGVLYDEFQGHKRIAKRAVFLVDTDGVVQYAWSTDDPTDQPDWQAVRDAVDALEAPV
ncbi:redoxin domain-containing protein [Salinibaculum salinum]|uniref:redoxin domain-containing protein n=1 Tax=Salinibaculum salinum TaxID=3131996 RepID=UPI0030EF793F